MSKQLYIVACVATKPPHRAAACDLYRSDWFVKARAYVEQRRAPWLILSALHGLIDPNAMIDPYELTLNNLSTADRHMWGCMMAQQLGSVSATYRSCDIVLFAGRASVPMEGLGIGEGRGICASRAE